MHKQLNSHVVSLLQRLQRGLSTVELVHTPHELWPLPQRTTLHPTRPLRISVLDSSFNPPTLAHLALANSPLPRFSDVNGGDGAVPPPNEKPLCDYDAKLLLLSVRNADKSLKPTDATFLQRIEMVILLAREIVRYGEGGTPIRDGNVAVAIIDEPRFVDKSSTLLTFIRRRLAELMSLPRRSPSSSSIAFPAATLPTPTPQLIFLQGFDTLERVVSLRYYSSEEAMIRSLRRFLSPGEDNSRIVCARRVVFHDGLQDYTQQGSHWQEFGRPKPLSTAEQQTLGLAQEFVQTGRIILIDLGKNEQTISSSEIRGRILRGDDGWRTLTTESIANYILGQKLYATSA